MVDDPRGAPLRDGALLTRDDRGAIDTSDWLDYETTDGDASVRYPADWTLESDAQPAAEPTQAASSTP